MKMKKTIYVLLMMLLLLSDPVHSLRTRLRHKAKMRLQKKADALVLIIGIAFLISYIISSSLKLYSAYIMHKINLRREMFINSAKEFQYIIRDMKLLNCVRKMNTDLTNNQLIATVLSNNKINESEIEYEKKSCDCTKYEDEEESADLEPGIFDGIDPMDPKLRDFLDSYNLDDIREKENVGFMKYQEIEEESSCLEKFNKLGVIDPNDEKCRRFKHLLYKTTLKKYKLLNLLNPDVIFGAAHQRIRNARALFVNAEARGSEILSLVKETDFMGFPVDPEKKEKVLGFIKDIEGIMKKVTGTGITASNSADELLTTIEKFVESQITNRLDKILAFATKQIEDKHSLNSKTLNQYLKFKAAELIMFAKEKAEAVEIEIEFSLPTMKNLRSMFDIRNVKEKFVVIKEATKVKLQNMKTFFKSGAFKKKAKLILTKELIDFRTFAIEKASNWLKEKKIFNKKIADLTKSEIVINIYQIIRKHIFNFNLEEILRKVRESTEIPDEMGGVKNLNSYSLNMKMPKGFLKKPSARADPEKYSLPIDKKFSQLNPFKINREKPEDQNISISDIGIVLDEPYSPFKMDKYRKMKMNKISDMHKDNAESQLNKQNGLNFEDSPTRPRIPQRSKIFKVRNINSKRSSNYFSSSEMRFIQKENIEKALEPINIPKLKGEIIKIISQEANKQIKKFNLNMVEFDVASLAEEIPGLEIEQDFEINKVNVENYINLIQIEVMSNFRDVLTENTTILFNKFSDKVIEEITGQFTMDTSRFDSNVFGIVDQVWEKGNNKGSILEELSSNALSYTKNEFEDIKNNTTINPYSILRNSEAIDSIMQKLELKEYLNEEIRLSNIIKKAEQFSEMMELKDVTHLSRENLKKFFDDVLNTIKMKIRNVAARIKKQITVKNAVKYGKKILKSVVTIVKDSAKETISETVIGILNRNINGLELESLDSESLKASAKGLVIKALNREKNKYINELKSTALEMILEEDLDEINLNTIGLKFLDFNKSYGKTISEKFKSGLKKSAEGIFNDIKKEFSPGRIGKKIGADVLKKMKGKVNKFIEKPTSFARAVNLRKMLARQAGFAFKEKPECFEICLVSKQISGIRQNIFNVSKRLFNVSRKITKRACTNYDYGQKEYTDKLVGEVKRKMYETDQKIFDETFKIIFIAMKVMNNKLLSNATRVVNVVGNYKVESERERLKHKEGRTLLETFRYMYLEMEEMEEEYKNDNIVKKINNFRSTVKTFIDLADDFLADDMGYIGVILSMSTVIFAALEVGGYLIFYLRQRSKDNNELKTEFAWEMFLIKAKKFVIEVKNSIIKKIFAPIVIAIEIGSAINKVRKALILSRNEDRQLKSGELMLHQRAIHLVKNNEFESCKANLATLSFVNDVYEPVRIIQEKIKEIKEKSNNQPELEENPIINPRVRMKYQSDLIKSRSLEGCYYNLPTCLLNKEDSSKVFNSYEKSYFEKFFSYGFYSTVVIALNFENYQLYKSQGFEVIKGVYRNGTDLSFEEALKYNYDADLFKENNIKDIDNLFVIMACRCSTKIYIEKLRVYNISSPDKAYTLFNIERKNSNLDCVQTLNEILPPECDDLLIYTVTIGYETLIYSTRSVNYKTKIDYAFHRYFNDKSIHAQFDISKVTWKSLRGTQHSSDNISAIDQSSTDGMHLDTERDSLLINDYSGKRMYFKIFDSFCIQQFNRQKKQIIEIIEEETVYPGKFSKFKGAIAFNWVMSEENLHCDSIFKANSQVGISFNENLVYMKINGENIKNPNEETILFEKGDVLDFDFFSIYSDRSSKTEIERKIVEFEQKVYDKIDKKTIKLDFYRNYILENKRYRDETSNYDIYSTTIVFYKKHSLNKESQLNMKAGLDKNLRTKICNLRLNPCSYRDKMQVEKRYPGVQEASTEINSSSKYHLVKYEDKSAVEFFKKTNAILNKTVISENILELEKHTQIVENEKENIRRNTNLFSAKNVNEKGLKKFFEKYNYAILPNKVNEQYIIQEMGYIQGFAGIVDNFSSVKCKKAVKELFKDNEYSLQNESQEFENFTSGYHNMTRKLEAKQLNQVKIEEILRELLNMTQLEDYLKHDSKSGEINKNNKYRNIGKKCKYFNFTLAFNPREDSEYFNAKVEKKTYKPGEEKPVAVTGKEKNSMERERELAVKEYYEINYEKANPEISMHPTMWVDIGLYPDKNETGSKNMFENVEMAHLNGYDLITNPIDNQLKGSEYLFGKEHMLRMNFYAKTRRVLDIDYQSICPGGN